MGGMEIRLVELHERLLEDFKQVFTEYRVGKNEVRNQEWGYETSKCKGFKGSIGC